MTTQFSPPPTYAEVIIFDRDGRNPRFNPIWLKWFLDVTALLTSAGGGGGGGFEHNSLTGIQGGSSGDYYHLTGVQHTDVITLRAQLANAVNPALGAALVGYDSTTVAAALSTLETDLATLISDLADDTNPALGAGMIGYAGTTVAAYLDSFVGGSGLTTGQYFAYGNLTPFY